MKKFTTLALATAMTAAMTCSAFAADPLLSGSVSGDSARPTEEVYVVDTTSLTDEQRASIASAEFSFTVSSNFLNGGGGYNTNGTDWTQPAGYEFKAAEDDGSLGSGNVYTMPIENYALGEDGSDSLQVQMWWLNINPDGSDATATLDSVVLKDADGNVLLSVGDVATPDPEPSIPAGDTAPVAYLAAVVALAGVALVASKKARA